MCQSQRFRSEAQPRQHPSQQGRLLRELRLRLEFSWWLLRPLWQLSRFGRWQRACPSHRWSPGVARKRMARHASGLARSSRARMHRSGELHPSWSNGQRWLLYFDMSQHSS